MAAEVQDVVKDYAYEGASVSIVIGGLFVQVEAEPCVKYNQVRRPMLSKAGV